MNERFALKNLIYANIVSIVIQQHYDDTSTNENLIKYGVKT